MAVSALIVCSPLLFASRPKTPLRVLCIAAFEFLARLRGGTLGQRCRRALAQACDFGSLCDAYYDCRQLDAGQYRSLRRELHRIVPEAATRRYLRQLREAERGRPVLSASHAEIVPAAIAYRTAVLDLSLRWMREISGVSVEGAKFQVLLNLVGLMQMVDDLLDWKEDLAKGSPSYVTALLLDRPKNEIAVPLGAQADLLFERIVGAARQDADAWPFAVAGRLTRVLVTVLLRARFPR